MFTCPEMYLHVIQDSAPEFKYAPVKEVVSGSIYATITFDCDLWKAFLDGSGILFVNKYPDLLYFPKNNGEIFAMSEKAVRAKSYSLWGGEAVHGWISLIDYGQEHLDTFERHVVFTAPDGKRSSLVSISQNKMNGFLYYEKFMEEWKHEPNGSFAKPKSYTIWLSKPQENDGDKQFYMLKPIGERKELLAF